MKLTAKIVTLWMAGTLIVVAAGTYFAIRHDLALLREDMEADALEIGRTLAPLIQDAWKTSGEQRALQLIRDADQDNHQVEVGWVWLEGPDAKTRATLSPENQQALREGTAVYVEERDASGEGSLYSYVPVSVASPRRGAIELRNSLNGLDRLAHAAILRFAAMGAVLILFSAAAASLVGLWLVGRPLAQLIDKTRRVGSGELSNPVHLVRRDELTELARALNLMCNQLAVARERLRAETDARIAALDQLRHADRLKTVGRLAGGMAHELATPLNVVSARAELIGLEAPSDSAVASAKVIKDQIQTMSAMIRQLLDFGRRGRAQKQTIELRELCERTVQLLEPLARRRNVTLDLAPCDSHVLAEVDGPQMQQVLSNMIENATHAMPQGGTVTLRVDPGPFERKSDGHPSGSGCARIVVKDQGVGISHENLQHIFDPFFTTKEVGKGTGLGLSIAYGIVQDHGGWIEVTSAPGVGTEFLIYLPQARGPQDPERPSAVSPEEFGVNPAAGVSKQATSSA